MYDVAFGLVCPQDLNTMDSDLPNTMEWALYLLFSVAGRLVIVCYTTPIFILLALPMTAVYRYVQVGSSRPLVLAPGPYRRTTARLAINICCPLLPAGKA